MKSCVSTWGKGALLFLLLAGGLWLGAVWAAEPGETSQIVYDTMLSRGITYIKTHYTRATWDDLMRWVNFFILAGLIFKYARTPMANFLQGRKAETARAIGRMEEKKREAEAKLRDGQAQLQNSRDRLERIKERIIAEGERRKAQMIADAKRESRIMLEAAKIRIEHQISDACQIIRAEMIETAADKALSKLPGMMTEKDHQRMVDLWMEEATQ